jgi:hypothetical protein
MMLFAFVVESTSRKTVSATPDGQVDGAGTNQIVFLSQHGFQTRAAMGGGSCGRQGPLIAGSLGQNGFDEFVGDYQELVHSFVLRQVFEEGVGWIAADGAADIRHYGQSQVRGVGDMVDGCEVLSRRPDGLVGTVGKAAWDLDMATPSRPALDDELTCELDNASGPERWSPGRKMDMPAVRRAYGQPCLQTQLRPVSTLPSKLPPVTDIPSGASTTPSTPWHYMDTVASSERCLPLALSSRFATLPTHSNSLVNQHTAYLPPF